MNFKIGDVLTDLHNKSNNRIHYKLIRIDDIDRITVQVIKSNINFMKVGTIIENEVSSTFSLVEKRSRITGHHLTKIFK